MAFKLVFCGDRYHRRKHGRRVTNVAVSHSFDPEHSSRLKRNSTRGMGKVSALPHPVKPAVDGVSKKMCCRAQDFAWVSVQVLSARVSPVGKYETKERTKHA